MAKSEHRGKIKPRNQNFKQRVPELGYYFIVTDTEETEQNYIYGLRDSVPNSLQGKIVIKIVETRTRNLVDEAMNLQSLNPQYGKIWILFDRDEVKNFDGIINSAINNGIEVGWSNPCIEIWFDAYFNQMHTYRDSVTCCRNFTHTFKSKTGIKYEKSDRNIYALLNQYGNEKTAIEIAEKRLNEHLRNGFTMPSHMCPCTTVHRLVKEIKQKTEY